MTLEQYETMRAKQKDKCLICKHTPEKLLVDHCHKTGKIRGLLCNSCNLGLGHFKDVSRSLVRALKYVSRKR